MKLSRDSEAGFTLVELLVTLALLSLMLVYSVSAFSILRDLDRVSDDAAAQQEVEAAWRYMRDVLTDVRVRHEQNGSGQPRLLFRGDADQIQLVAASNGDRETGGLYVVRFLVSDERQLISERALLQREAGDMQNTVALLNDVTSVRFAFAANPAPGAEFEFEDDWTVANELPVAIRMSVTFAEGDHRRWPETIALVRAAR